MIQAYGDDLEMWTKGIKEHTRVSVVFHEYAFCTITTTHVILYYRPHLRSLLRYQNLLCMVTALEIVLIVRAVTAYFVNFHIIIFWDFIFIIHSR